MWRYGDPESFALKAALAAKHAVSPEQIVIGEGIDGIWQSRALFVAPGVPVVTSEGAYPTFNYHVAGFGAGWKRSRSKAVMKTQKPFWQKRALLMRGWYICQTPTDGQF